MDDAQQSHKEPTKKDWAYFWYLIVIQSQNAFNEKAAQFLLIPLAAWLWKEEGSLEYLLGAIIVLPYILFAPIVGWLSDCFSKSLIIKAMCFLQIGVMALMWYCLENHNIHAAIAWFCIFAIQATVLSPARKGIVKNMLGSRSLGFASGLIEMSIVFAILAAQIGVFIWFDALLVEDTANGGWHAAAFPTLVFMLLAIPTSIGSLFIPSYGVTNKHPFKLSLFFEHFNQLKFLWRQRNLRLSEIGISYFWFLAGVLMLITIQIAKEKTCGGEGFGWEAALLMIWLSGGVVVGGSIASILSRKKIELGLIPLGAIGLTIGCFFTACFPVDSIWCHIGFSITGAFAAAYLVPLNAYLQDKCDESSRGNIIAAGNLMDMLMGLVAVGFQMMMKELISVQAQFVVLGILGVGITIIALRLIPREFIRMLGLWFMHFFYRYRVIGQTNIPQYGGVLIISNHVTYGDALFLSMVSPRPIRFIVAEEFVTMKYLGWLLELFDCLPISSRKPREALSKAIKALKDGEVICIFPEGQLTRTGTLCAARRGLEVMARKSHCPIIPIYLDELWGSVLSFSGNKFFSKRPRRFRYRFTAAVGSALDPQTITPPEALNALRELSAKCITVSAGIGNDEVLNRLEAMKHIQLVNTSSGSITAGEIARHLINRTQPNGTDPISTWIRALLACCADRDSLNRKWMNAQQIARVNALQPQELLLTTVGYQESQEEVVSVLWPILTKTPIFLLSKADKTIPDNICQIAGALTLRQRLYNLVPNKRLQFYDFSNRPALVLPNTAWKPCYCTSHGIVLAMSMCHSVFRIDDGTVQLGMRARTRGRLLPGFYTDPTDGKSLQGASLSESYPLPDNIYLDESGFLAELQVIAPES